MSWTAVAALLLVSVAVLLYLSISILPKSIVHAPNGLHELHGNELVQAENTLEQERNSLRGTLVQAVGGALVFLTFAVGLGQLFTAREGQVVDRFTKSIEQLGAESIDVALGGIYALRQIAERREYTRPIADIFIAYLKTHATDPVVAEDSAKVQPDHRSYVVGLTSTDAPMRLRPDLQAVLRILVGEGLWRRAGIARLDLSYIAVRKAELPRADLSDVELVGAILDEADLREAKLDRAVLRNASLVGADLSGADLSEAKLNDAWLSRARLQNAHLTNEVQLVDAHLDGADLTDADLRLCDARRADFSGAKLIAAQLDQAVLTEAKFAQANLSSAKLGSNRTIANACDLDQAVMDDHTRTQIDALLVEQSTDATIDVFVAYDDPEQVRTIREGMTRVLSPTLLGPPVGEIPQLALAGSIAIRILISGLIDWRQKVAGITFVVEWDPDEKRWRVYPVESKTPGRVIVVGPAGTREIFDLSSGSSKDIAAAINASHAL